VNTGEPYERRADRTVRESPAPSGAPAVAALAVRQDSSLADEPTGIAETSAQAHASIVWVRPTDVITTYGAARLRRAVDGQAEVVGRYRRAPLTAASSLGGRISRSAIARTEPAVRTPTSPSEGVQL
jgi:hypothetical protein